LATWFDSALNVVFLGTALAAVILVFVIAHEMGTGIFRRFFLLLKLTVIVILVGRADVLLPDYGLTTLVGYQTADYVYRVVWSILLMLAFIALYVDWRSTSLDQPIKPRSVTKVEG